MTRMNEQTINTLFDIVTDPVKNVYDKNDRKNLDEIMRLIRIFNIQHEQKEMSGIISARGLVAFKMLLSNN